MRTIVQTIGEPVQVVGLDIFTFFEFNGKVFVKLCNRNANIVDAWDPEEDKPEWFMPGTMVCTVATRSERQSRYRREPFGSLPEGTLFDLDKAGAPYPYTHCIKAYRYNTPEEAAKRTAFDIGRGEFFELSGDTEVIPDTSLYKVVKASGGH